MTRRLVLPAALAQLAVLLSGAASAQSCTGRFVNPISDVCWECHLSDPDRADHDRQRLRRAGHSELVLANLPLRLVHSPHRALARSIGAAAAGGAAGATTGCASAVHRAGDGGLQVDANDEERPLARASRNGTSSDYLRALHSRAGDVQPSWDPRWRRAVLS